MVREVNVSPDQLVQPLFVTYKKGAKEPIASMPGQYRFSVDRLTEEIRAIYSAGVGSVLLFGIPEHKDERGSSSSEKDGVVQQAITAVKEAVPSMFVITDVCLCEYTSHGHCGIVKNGHVDNDLSIEPLAGMALSHATAGADMVAPSDMMDGRVRAIRQALDNNGHSRVPIMSYSAKYASAFYGPFREAAGSAPSFGDRKTYQMDPPNVREAMKEIKEDIEEGADIVMVKPALSYLDVIARAREKFDIPIAAYNVSGEYAMIKAAASQGWLDEKRAVIETLTSIKRAGADVIITYFAKEYGRSI